MKLRVRYSICRRVRLVQYMNVRLIPISIVIVVNVIRFLVIWRSTRDPKFTDEEFEENIRERIENLGKIEL